MRIIILDDELSALNTFLPHILDDTKIECQMFMNEPVRAVEYVKNNPVEVAFLDIKMPSTNGIEVAKKMLFHKPDIKIVFISAYAENEERIIKELDGKVAGFCHKPYRKETLLKMLADFKNRQARPEIFIKTFDRFDLFVNGVAVDFSSSKAKELLALLVDARGSYVGLDAAIETLWPNKNVDLSKRLYRDAVSRLRLTLKAAGAEDLVSFERARAVINVKAATCDMWNCLESGRKYSGRYLPQYGWSVLTETILEKGSPYLT